MIVESARVRLNLWQQAAVAVGSAVGALLDPRRADLIAALGETTGKPAFQSVLERMKRSPEGRTPAEKIIQGTSMTLGQVEAFFKDKVQDSPNGRNVDMSNDEVSKHKVAEPAPIVDSISNGTSEAAVQASGNGLEVKVALSNQDTLIDVEEHDRSIKSGGRKKNHSVKTWYDNETFEGVSSYP
ncbi:hypothetical protein LWI28_027917 [Acer negundo]|uniref:Uncharacterized protein n=1 Tax=Acer negundo TaxID=4023 RepID=A0AAD5IY31_ACENE|nr:hypothetical protein LWI28_027917 [Acer negundo]